MIMSFVLNCRLEIGSYLFTSVNNIKVESSRKKLTDTAVITLPNKYASRFLSNEIKSGDKVTIWINYVNFPTEKVFEGYVLSINPGRPITINCEDEMYQLKRKHLKGIAWESTTLKNVLEYMVPEIKTNCPQITLAPFYIKKDTNVAAALDKLKDTYGIDVYFRNKVLFAGLAYTDTDTLNKPVVVYDLDKNVLPNPPLTYRVADQIRMKIKAISILPNNKKLETEVGDGDGSVTTLHFYNVTSIEELKRQAKVKLEQMKYDGFAGNIVTMGLPHIEHGYTLKIIDNRDDGSRSGYYFADSVVTTFGIGGYRKEVYIGRRAKA